jgi:hypothetical protein
VIGSFSDYVTIVDSTTNQTLASAIVSFDEATSGTIAVNASAARQQVLHLPDGPVSVGQLSFTVVTDYYGQVFESNASTTGENNNSTSITLTSTIASYPDLQVGPTPPRSTTTRSC